MNKILNHKIVQETLELLSIASTKQDVIEVEYGVLEILSDLQKSAELFSDEEERTLLFSEARKELLEVINNSMSKFAPPKKKFDKKSKQFISPEVLEQSKKAYKAKRHTYIDEDYAYSKNLNYLNQTLEDLKVIGEGEIK